MLPLLALLVAWQSAAPAPRAVLRVIDGDTLVLDGNETVRLVGVDAPEMAGPRGKAQCFALQAAGYASKQAEGKRVRFERDGTKDAYGRSLGYIYLPNGKLLNAELVRLGYARAYVRFPFRLMPEFVILSRQPRRTGGGCGRTVWNPNRSGNQRAGSGPILKNAIAPTWPVPGTCLRWCPRGFSPPR